MSAHNLAKEFDRKLRIKELERLISGKKKAIGEETNKMKAATAAHKDDALIRIHATNVVRLGEELVELETILARTEALHGIARSHGASLTLAMCVNSAIASGGSAAACISKENSPSFSISKNASSTNKTRYVQNHLRINEKEAKELLAKANGNPTNALIYALDKKYTGKLTNEDLNAIIAENAASVFRSRGGKRRTHRLKSKRSKKTRRHVRRV